MSKVILFLLFSFGTVQAQEVKPQVVQVVQDSIPQDTLSHTVKFHYKSLIILVTLLGYGVIGIESDQLKFFNTEIREEVGEHIDEKITIDDFSQYAPLAAVYALNLAGIKGKNNLKDRTIIAATSYIIMASTVLALKSSTKIERPDGSSFNSFPSGHTATAFAGAEMLWQEYKDKSPWYGIAGYAVASGTGIFRIVNNRHWLTDVAAGAGIGILSTKVAYWIHPWVKSHLFGNDKNKKTATVMVPFYNGKETGIGFLKTF